MNEKLDLVEILKDCPKGTILYSPFCGDVYYDGIDRESYCYPINVCCAYDRKKYSFCKDGRYIQDALNGECLLFPSKEERDWSKFKVKKPKFDLMTLQPFDKVLVRYENKKWQCDMFSYLSGYIYMVNCVGGAYEYCIPYNEDTKYLVGTTKEAPEYYRYWEN